MLSHCYSNKFIYLLLDQTYLVIRARSCCPGNGCVPALILKPTVNVRLVWLQIRQQWSRRYANDGAKIIVVVLTHKQAI